MKREQRMQLFAHEIWQWYARHKRSLPWRDLAVEDPTQRAYQILVSEVMLQQTQVSRVKIVFKDFLRSFPRMEDLAQASNREVLLAWRGMGYNNRALRLRDAVQTVIKDRNGVFPEEYESLIAIKGIGPYTAAAIRNFAFNLPTPCIDTNIRRILHRTFVGPESSDGRWKMNDRDLLKIAEEVLDVALHHPPPTTHYPLVIDAANWHAALMDFGSLVQTKNAPRWEICPLTEKGITKTTPKQWEASRAAYSLVTPSDVQRREPGRFEGARFVPNRIFRGRIIEALRDAPTGLSSETLGRSICHDWSKDLDPWLKSLIKKLVQEEMIAQKKNGKYALPDS